MHFLSYPLSMSFHRHSLPSWSCGFSLQFVQLMRSFWVLFLSHTAPGFQLWFHFHLCLWVIHWGLLLRLPWRTCESQVWKWGSCLGHRGSGSTRYSEKLAARAAGNRVLQKGMATRIGLYPPASLPGEPHCQRGLAGHSTQGCKELDTTEATLA